MWFINPYRKNGFNESATPKKGLSDEVLGGLVMFQWAVFCISVGVLVNYSGLKPASETTPTLKKAQAAPALLK